MPQIPEISGRTEFEAVLLTGVALLDGMLLLSFWRQFRRYGTFGLPFFRKDDLTQSIQDAATLVAFVLLSWQAVMAARPSAKLAILIRTHEQLLEWSRIIGAALLFGGVALCLAAQYDLGARGASGSRTATDPRWLPRVFTASAGTRFSSACSLPSPAMH